MPTLMYVNAVNIKNHIYFSCKYISELYSFVSVCMYVCVCIYVTLCLTFLSLMPAY